jgi:hypothetical protein
MAREPRDELLSDHARRAEYTDLYRIHLTSTLFAHGLLPVCLWAHKTQNPLTVFPRRVAVDR